MNLPFNRSRPQRGEPDPAYDARPLVALRRQDRSAWWFAGGIIIAAALLFAALEARRQAVSQAEQPAAETSLAAPQPIPELVMPAMPQGLTASPATTDWLSPDDQRRNRLAAAPAPQPRITSNSIAPEYYPESIPYQPPLPPQDVGQAAPLANGQPGFAAPPSAAAGDGYNSAVRIMAGRLENPAMTVIQGTLINAVLETALDSTRPGQARAVVTRNVYGFDGTRLLIPRGSKLYGTYDANVSQGQKRAQIEWKRLLRPDGVSVALNSPAADPLGRAGVAGKVNSHFFQRLGNALIGTTANIGSALVTQSVAPSSPVVVAVPGATQSVTQSVAPSATQIMPTLTVRQGTRVTVFVEHDLDFSSVEEGY